MAKKTVLEVIRPVLKPKPKTENSSGSETKTESETVKTEGGQAKAGETPAAKADDKPPPFHDHPRWKEVVKQKSDLETAVQTLEPDAKEFRALRNYADQHRIPMTDVIGAVQWLALVRSDPAKARESIVKTLSDLDEVLGVTLSDDLKERVKSGELTEDAAKELSANRAAKKLAEARVSQADDDRQQTVEQERVRVLHDSIRKEVKTWETKTAERDPDFAKKRGLISDRIRALIVQRGAPFRSAEDAVKVSQQAYEDVTKSLQDMLPAPKPKTFVRHEGGPGSAEPAKPASMKEAIRAGMNRGKS